MKKLITIIFILIIPISYSFCQGPPSANVPILTTTKDTTYWKKGGFMSLTINQVSLSNWASGGQSNVAANSVINLYASYKKGETTWDNFADLGFGFMKPDKQKLQKTDDKLEFTSKFGTIAKGKWYYTGLANFKSQFISGYKKPPYDNEIISKFMAPGYATIALGLEYRPVQYFSMFVSPATGKFTFVLDQSLANQGAYGVDKAEYDNANNLIKLGKKIRPEFGAYYWMRFQKDIAKNINLLVKLNLFNNYTDKNLPNRKNIDVDWNVALTIKANKWLTTSIITQLIYDNDINVPIYDKNDASKQIGSGPRTQFKELLGIGLSYKFGK